jgi:hypothetical protein
MGKRLLLYPVLFLLFAFAVTGCKREKQISGKAFVEREVLIDVLVDLHLVDGVTQDRQFGRKYDADSIDVLSPILEKHQISKQMFDTTMYVYTRNPKLLDEVYNDVLIKLNVMLDENSKEEPARPTEE